MATLPSISLNDLSQQYRDFLAPFKENASEKIIGQAIKGKHTAYALAIKLNADTPRTFWYCGQTKQLPEARLSQHKSTLLTCTTTTFNGKSSLFDPVVLAGLQSIELEFHIVAAGLAEHDAKKAEDFLSSAFRAAGQEVLTNPTKRDLAALDAASQNPFAKLVHVLVDSDSQGLTQHIFVEGEVRA